MVTDGGRPVVLVVEDEPDVAETYELWLRERYEVLRAESGPAALDVLGQRGEEVDVVLLDRMMPGMAGDEVLREIRERDVDVRVAMVTAVDPDFDIVELGFDDYVTKPPTREGLRSTVEDLLERDAYAAEVQEYHSLVSKRAALSAQKSESALSRSEEFQSLEARIDELGATLEADRDRLVDDATFVSTLRELTGSDGGRDDEGAEP